MSISSWFPWKLGRQHSGQSRPPQSSYVRRRGTRLAVEQLEDRTVPSNYMAVNVNELIAAINDANAHPGSNTISLTAPKTSPYTLATVDNTTGGANGLPVIASGNDLTIQGNGDTIARSTAAGTPAFRLFDVAAGASLKLANVTVQGGLASWAGGGIYSRGSLTLEAGTVISGNQAIGYPGEGYIDVWDPYYGWRSYPAPGGSAYGGGVYVSAGTATLTNISLASNLAQGGPGAITPDGQYGVPGEGLGGGLYVAAGTVTLTNSIVSSNSAQGYYYTGGGGGGVYVSSGTVTLTNSFVSSNSAQGYNASGGGVYVYDGTVTLTSNNVSSNTMGVYVRGGTVTLASNSLSSNIGDALLVDGGTVTLTYDILSSNTRGVSVRGGTVTLTDVTVSSNATGGDGGGLWVAGGTVILTHCTLSSNTAGYNGGGLYAWGGTVTLRDCTVTGNVAGLTKARKQLRGHGGGLNIDPRATVYLDAFTVAHTTGNTPDNIYGSYILIA